MKKVWIWLALFSAILVIGIIGSIWVLQRPTGNMVEIMRDGEVLYRLDLADYKEAATIELEYNGGRNTILIEDGKICISHADCPDQTCVKMGWLQSSAFPIVCLPHHLVIQYTENNDTVDGMVN